ncbi:MAG: DUF2231 domain-containing protein [Wenzhouxiangella sp.]
MVEKPRPDDDLESRLSIKGHPLHAMMVSFPIAFLISVAATDVLWLLLQDDFWARLSLWLVGAGAFAGAAAGLVGTIELLLIPGVRRRGVSWSHFIAAMTLLSVAFTNWYLRLADPVDTIMPWGLALSLLGAGLVGVAGWLGANLVFDHRIGIVDKDGD